MFYPKFRVFRLRTFVKKGVLLEHGAESKEISSNKIAMKGARWKPEMKGDI